MSFCPSFVRGYPSFCCIAQMLRLTKTQACTGTSPDRLKGSKYWYCSYTRVHFTCLFMVSSCLLFFFSKRCIMRKMSKEFDAAADYKQLLVLNKYTVHTVVSLLRYLINQYQTYHNGTPTNKKRQRK